MGIFLFLGSKGTWIMFKFHTVISNHKKEKEDLTKSLLPSLQIGAQTILKMCHSYWADSRKGRKWALPSIQLGSFKGIIVHRVRHEVSSGMFLSVDILTKLIVLLLRSASLRILWKVKYVQNHLIFFFKLGSVSGTKCKTTVSSQKWLSQGADWLGTTGHHRHCWKKHFHEWDLCVFPVLMCPVAKHIEAIWTEVAKSQRLHCWFVTRKAKASRGFRFLPHQRCFSFCGRHKRHCTSKRKG